MKEYTRKDWYERMIAWREAHITEKHFVLLLSLMVGVMSALAAVILKGAIHLIQHWLETAFMSEINYWYLISPAIGIAHHMGSSLDIRLSCIRRRFYDA